MNGIIFLTISAILLTLSSVGAQEIITDRPDFTESAVVVQSRIVQIESGVQFTDFNSVEEFSYPNALARIGLGYNLEIRLGFSGWSSITVGDASSTYLNDLLFEVKYQITGENAEIPMAVLLVSTLPTGDDEVSVGSTESGLKFASAYDFTDQFGLSVNLGAISIEVAEEREILSLFSVSLGLGLSDRLGAFLETFAEIPHNDVWQPVVDGGFTYLLNPTTQLDLYMGKGLNDYAADLIVGGGFSILFGY